MPRTAAIATRILFLARRFPPSIGGMQRYCYELHRQLCRQRPVRLLSLGRDSLLHLAWYMPYIFCAALWAGLFRRTDVIYFADGVTAALAPLLRPFCRARFVATIFGLELAYHNPIARGLMARGTQTCDQVVVISEATRQVALDLGVQADKIQVVYVGIDPLVLSQEEYATQRQAFEEKHQVRFGQDRILLNFGRLVPRKGVAAFVEKGLSLLEADIRLIVAGGGTDFKRVQQLRRELGLEERIILLESPSDETIAMLRHSADLFLFPNVPTPNNLEGFGMTHLEAMHAGTPAVCFAVDAIVESAREGGYLVEPNDYAAFAAQIHAYYRLSPAQREAKRQEAREYVQREYSWERTAAEYLAVFEGS